MATIGYLTVVTTPEQHERSKEAAKAGRPAHWVDASGCKFQNPWASHRSHSFSEIASLPFHMSRNSPVIPKDLKERFPVLKPTWGLPSTSSTSFTAQEKVKATWLGHACFLLELPVRPSQPNSGATAGRGARILFDPVFSERCSPSQLVGPKRYTEMPCGISEIPEIDVIAISHNHYDHMDTHTLTTLWKRNPSRRPHIFAPLGNAPYLRSLGFDDEHVHICDWWDARRVEIDVEAGGAEKHTEKAKLAFDITCVPAQHATNRGVLDRMRTLWSGWVLQEVLSSSSSVPSANTSAPQLDVSIPRASEDTKVPGAADAPALTSDTVNPTRGAKVYFAGDTGYRSVMDGQDEDTVPTCPAFKEIGERFDGFDFAMIPIGAYMPRQFMSPMHVSPADSVCIFQDVRAKKAIGMHWGTWVLTTEDVLEPPVKLAEACKKKGIPEGAFGTCKIGETVLS